MSTNLPDHTRLLRWWHQHQAQQLNHEADLIRNGLLQDMFALRRRLELSCQSQPNAEAFDCPAHLADLKRLYAKLEALSNRLGSPYLQESLPLALQYALQPWQARFPWQLNLPLAWGPEPVEHTRLLILLMETLLATLTPIAVPSRAILILQTAAGIQELTLELIYDQGLPPALAPTSSTNLSPLLETFQLLTQGEYGQTATADTLSWTLRWPAVIGEC